MEDYNKIIESLGVRFINARHIGILQSVTIENYYDVENKLILVTKGNIYLNGKNKLLKGDVLFLPGGKTAKITFGQKGKQSLVLEEYINNKDSFLKPVQLGSRTKKFDHVFSSVSFEAKVFNTVNFFSSIDIPPVIVRNEKVERMIRDILREMASEEPGSARIVKLNTDHLVVEIIRYILREKLFEDKLSANITYFKDPRLIDIFTYIKENLGGDLSNKNLAEVASVSEDYVGQYFKLLTGINPQDYIEYQRMEMAVQLLRTSKKSIRDISKDIGYKDTAYFCRRFKMMFGIPAGKMRRRESLMNV